MSRAVSVWQRFMRPDMTPDNGGKSKDWTRGRCGKQNSNAHNVSPNDAGGDVSRYIPAPFPKTVCPTFRGVLLLVIAIGFVRAQSNSRLTGRVVDASDLAVPRAEILVRNSATLVE